MILYHGTIQRYNNLKEETSLTTSKACAALYALGKAKDLKLTLEEIKSRCVVAILDIKEDDDLLEFTEAYPREKHFILKDIAIPIEWESVYRTYLPKVDESIKQFFP